MGPIGHSIVTALLIGTAFLGRQVWAERPSRAQQQAAQKDTGQTLAAGDSRSSSSLSEAVHVPDVTLIDMDGRPVSLRRVLSPDLPVMVNFIFTTCATICPVMSAVFAQVQTGLGPDHDRFRMVSISIDPEHDTPARLREYAKTHGAGPDWRFLTGTPTQIEAVLRAFSAYRGNKMNHAPLTFLRARGSDRWTRLEGISSARDLIELYRRIGSQ